MDMAKNMIFDFCIPGLDDRFSFENRVSMRGRENEKPITGSGSGSGGEINEKKMLGILHLIQYPESLQQDAEGEVRLAISAMIISE
jgi:hypothetical protein